MTLHDLFDRRLPPRPWEEGDRIPWHDPEFSRRMLREHLSQKHDAASRRQTTIHRQVNWIHASVLNGTPSRVLDLGCGPGLYTSRLACLGHACHGIDFSPASIEYAREHAPPGCTYALGDIRTAGFGSGYDLALFTYGEFNVFKPAQARRLIQRCFRALKPGGRLLLEVIGYEAVFETGSQPATWYTAERELFGDRPHLCLMEAFWDERRAVALERYFVVDLATGQVTRYAVSTQAYSDAQLEALLRELGFERVETHPSLEGEPSPSQSELFVLVAHKGSEA